MPLVVPPVTTCADALTFSVSVAVLMPLSLLAESVTGKVPLAVGTPLICPLSALTCKPAGNPLAPKRVGALVAVIT